MQSLGLHRRSLAFGAVTGVQGRVCFSADVAQPVELRFCKPEVRGSSPLVSSDSCQPSHTGTSGAKPKPTRKRFSELQEGCPSGQWEQAVNLPAYAYGGSNPPPSTRIIERPPEPGHNSGWQAGSDGAIGRAPPCGSSSVGRASAFQAERRGFESRLPLWARREHAAAFRRPQLFAHLAQMVERVLGKDEVTSSILVVGSKRFIGTRET